MKNDIYTDIATRTGGDIYIGVVGPVRTGKSTFIKQFMEQFVIPNIESDYRKERAIDELPQSSAGKTIMTTEPKFIPEEAVNITLEGGASFNVRMIDCVGYIIPSAIGYIENEAPRMVVTPWFDTEVPFNMAAEVGTQKVITEHSTIGLVVTADKRPLRTAFRQIRHYSYAYKLFGAFGKRDKRDTYASAILFPCERDKHLNALMDKLS